MENIEFTKLMDFDLAQRYGDKIQTFIARITDVQNESSDALGDRPLTSFFRLTSDGETTITFTDNSLPGDIKNRIIALFFSVFYVNDYC